MRYYLMAFCALLVFLSMGNKENAAQENDGVHVSTVRNLLELESLGFSSSFSKKQNHRLGDKVSTALQEIYNTEDLKKPENIKLFLPIIRSAFSDLRWIENEEDKYPKITLPLLQRLSSEVKSCKTRKRIGRLIRFIEDQTTKKRSQPASTHASVCRQFLEQQARRAQRTVGTDDV